MAKRNSFIDVVVCPSCGSRVELSFDADIGVLDYSTYSRGDVVIESVPLVPSRRAPIGPEADVDWDRPFWAVGLGRCPRCEKEVFARVTVRERRYAGAIPTTDALDLFAWGYLE